MDQPVETLVIINSVILVVFLLLAIYVLIQIILIIRRIKRLTAKAESVTEAVENIGEAFRQASTPVAIAKLINNLTKSLAKLKETKGRK